MTRLTALLALLAALLTASPAQAETDPCRLGGVPVVNCDRAAQNWRSQADQIPREHLDLVGRIKMWGRDYPMIEYGDMTVHLPKWDSPTKGALSHEVAHAVAWTYGLNEPYEARFWRNGKAVGRTTDYGRTSPREDLAECASAIVIKKTSRCDSGRISWLRERIFAGTQYAGGPAGGAA